MGSDPIQLHNQNNQEPWPMKITGWILSGLFAAFLLLASVTPKLLHLDVAVTSMTDIGWSPDHLLLIGVIELLCVVLYMVPRTALLGAIFTMALLGGALASNLRADMPMFSHTLFSIYLGIVMWLGLWLRDPQLHKVLPLLRGS
jgi:hypothetical protein